MIIKFPKKVGDPYLDSFINNVYNTVKASPNEEFIFDLTEVEHIGNQELLLFTAILKIFIDRKTIFRVDFFKRGVSTDVLHPRVKKQIIQIWEVWQIWQIVPNSSNYH